MLIHNDKVRLMISAAGIFICYFYFGVFQEVITRGRYGNEDGKKGERFTFTLALVGVQCFFNWLFAKAILVTRKQTNNCGTPAGYYASSALTYLLAMVSSNMALRYVAYPTQVVGKAAKPIPVMLLGVLLGRKSYSLQKYLFVILIVIGVALFMYKESKVNPNSENAGLGEVLLFMSLSMDGLTGAIQERMRAATKPSAQHMMLNMNFWSSIMLGFALLVTGEGKDFVDFALKHPVLLRDLASLSVAGALGQLFIFIMVSHFGPLPCSIVTTTRKFFSVLFSVMYFGNPLSNRQWFGTIFVFMGLFMDMLFGNNKKPNLTASNEKKSETKKLIANVE